MVILRQVLNPALEQATNKYNWAEKMINKMMNKFVVSWHLVLAAAGMGGGLLMVFLLMRPVLGQPARLAAASTMRESRSVAMITSPALSAPATDKAGPATEPWETFTVRPGDTLSALFTRAGLDQAECNRVMALGVAVETLRLLHPGEQLRLHSDGAGALTELRYTPDPLHTLKVTVGNAGLQAQMEERQPVEERTSLSDVVDDTLNHALLQAGLSASQAAEFVKIFHGRVNFRREIRRGTRFSLVYDKRRVENRTLPPGPIVAAELVLTNRTLRAFRFSGVSGDADYYDNHGKPMEPTLLRTPVHYSRISSPFSLHRFDPVVQVWRPHYGVDLAADIGTPIRAAGDGRITFIGPNGGYGNLVKIKHFGAYSTRYAHLRRFAPQLHRGSFVRQGQVIGYVGQSGEATGPHLHFEIRVNGIPRDPLKVKLPAGPPLDPRERNRFENAIRPLLALLENSTRGQSQLARVEEPATPTVRAL